MFTKPLEEIEIVDIDDLIENTRFQESERIEYKRTLPTKGNDIDPWFEGKNKIGNKAIKKLTSEIIAFANSHGGTLILGIIESDDKPSRPTALHPLPRCHELDHLLMQSIANSIEPGIDNLQSKVISTDKQENGIIIIQVPRSEFAPHRSTKDKEFYRRERHECLLMSAKEIKSLSLKRSRQKVEALWTVKYGDVSGQYTEGGVVVLDEGKIYGGDNQYYYAGIYEISNENRLIAYLQIEHYHGEQHTAFGTSDRSLSLVVDGNIIDNKITGEIYDPNTRGKIPFIMERKRALP